MLIGIVMLIAAVGLMYWAMWNAGRKPRTAPKIPRDRSKDTRYELWIGLG